MLYFGYGNIREDVNLEEERTTRESNCVSPEAFIISGGVDLTGVSWLLYSFRMAAHCQEANSETDHLGKFQSATSR